MDDEYVIFTKKFARQDSEDDLFIALTSDSDTQLMAVDVSDITIKSGLSVGSPVITMNFIDAVGNLVNDNRLDTNGNYYLYMGKSYTESTRIKLRISNMSFDNMLIGKSESYVFRVFFVLNSWIEFMHRTHNRGWSNARYSDVVDQIAAESGFSATDVSSTASVQSSLVQPYWSNLNMMRWIRERAQPANSNGHYEFGVSIKNEFFFLSTTELVRRAVRRHKANRNTEDDTVVPILKMGGFQENNTHREESRKVNGSVPTSFIKFTSSERFIDSVIQGAGGVEAQYYDYNQRKYVRSKRKFSNLPEQTISEWALIHPANELSSLKINGGRDSGVVSESDTRVSDVMMSLNGISLSTLGTPNIEIGDVIELIIPTPPDKTTKPINEIYSGFYFVSEVEHIFSLKKGNTYQTKLTISRQGIDGKSLSGFVKSQGGRMNVS